MIVAVLGPICTALTVSFVWPQVFRVYRRRTVEGIAPYGTLQGVAGCALWAMYGAVRGIPPVALSNSGVGLALLLIAFAQVRHRTLGAGRLVAAVVVIAAVGSAALALSTTLAGWLALVVGVTAILPQTWHVSRASELSGISLPMYGLIILSTVLWVTYGALIGDWLVVTTNALIAPCAVYVAVRAFQARSPRMVVAPDIA